MKSIIVFTRHGEAHISSHIDLTLEEQHVEGRFNLVVSVEDKVVGRFNDISGWADKYALAQYKHHGR